MRERASAAELLWRAATLYDDPSTGLARAARVACRGGFAAGAWWMCLALSCVRRRRITRSPRDFVRLGVLKYAAALLAAGGCGFAVTLTASAPAGALAAVVGFYVVECQMVFLFPLAIDGSNDLPRDSRVMTARAGGTLAAMRVVMPLAAFMLAGGFFGRGFLRSWCLGCLAVVIWYEQLQATPETPLVAEVA